MSVVVDTSPLMINRTAMYSVTRDVLEVLGDAVAGTQNYGVAAARPPDGRTAPDHSRLDQLIDAAAREATFDADLLALRTPRRPDGPPVFFLDPLYVLFTELREDDTVLLLDLSTVTAPGWHDPAVSRAYETAFARIAATAPKLAAISENTADTFVANYGAPRRPVEVIHLYVPRHLHLAVGAAKRAHVLKPYFLFVGSLETRKNVSGAMRAFALSGLAERGYELVIAGADAYGGEAIRREAADREGVRLQGYVTNAQLRSLYLSATGFVYPSYLEGFGVPLLEAMLYGVPAVSSYTGACPEVGGALVPYCDPDDHAAIARNMLRIAAMSDEQRAAWGAEARRRVEQEFSFTKFEARLREVVLEPR